MWRVLVLAPRVGLEPTTKGLTVPCSTAELPRNIPMLEKSSTGILSDILSDGKGISDPLYSEEMDSRLRGNDRSTLILSRQNLEHLSLVMGVSKRVVELVDSRWRDMEVAGGYGCGHEFVFVYAGF